MHRKLLIVAIAIAPTIVGAACAGTDADGDAEAARTALIEHLQARAASAATVSLARTFEERLPNVEFRTPTGQILRPVRQAVLGDIVDVEPGRAFRNVRDPDTGAAELPDFDDPTADWRSIHLVVDVVETFGDPLRGERLRVGMPISGSPDPRLLMDGAAALGRVFLLLDDGATQMFAYDPGVVGMVLGGEYLSTVDDDGTLQFPVLGREVGRGFQGELRTIDDVRRAAAEPTKVISVDEPSPGIYSRDEPDAVPAG